MENINNKKRNIREIISWIIKTTGKDKKLIFFSILVKSIQGLEGTIFALQLSNVINSCLYGETKEAIKHTAILGIIVIFAIVLYMLAYYLHEKGYAAYEKALRMNTFKSIITRDYSTITNTHSGEWMTKIFSDTFIVYQAFLKIIPELCGVLIQIISAIVVIINIFPKGMFLLVVACILIIVATIYLRKILQNYETKYRISESKYRSYVQEHLSNMIVIRSFSQENVVLSNADKKAFDVYDIRMKRNKFLTICFTLLYTGVRGGYFVGVILCGYLIVKNVINYGQMTAILQLVNLIITPITTLSSYIPELFTCLASAERLMDIEELPLDNDDEIYSDQFIRTFYDDSFTSIGLENATFAYNDMNNEYESIVINDFSFEVNKNDYIAIVGKSGSGKSTILKLLMNLYSLNKGRAYIKTKEKEDITLEPKWRNLFAYVPQGNYFESGSIREALKFGNDKISINENEIWRAIDIACATDFIKKLPNGLDTILSEKGSGLSEGQIQRLAIARAILINRPILMLDEATSALDELTERKVLENLRRMTNYTVFFVTHRPAALDICNKTIEL